MKLKQNFTRYIMHSHANSKQLLLVGRYLLKINCVTIGQYVHKNIIYQSN